MKIIISHKDTKTQSHEQAKTPSPVGEDMEPYDLGSNPGELGGVGEGVRSSDGAVPLTAATSEQVRKSRCLSQWERGC